MMKYNTLPQGTYENTRYKMLLQLEESGSEKLSPYVDPAGLPTIGAGFNLTDKFVRGYVFRTLDVGETGSSYAGLSAEGQIAEDSYVQRITDVIKASYSDSSDTSVLKNKLNTIMAERSTNPLITYAVNPTFTFNDAGEVRATFDGLMQDRYEDIVTNWLDLPDSTERLALLSLAYNGRTHGSTKFPATLGAKLKQALQNDDRAEAWFEIRYNTNLEHSGGVARRRYIESDMFSLYGEGVNAGNITDKQAKAAYRMFSRHRADTIYGNDGMIAYDNKYSNYLSGASTEATLIGLNGIGTLKQELNPAYTHLIDTYAADTGITIDWRDVTVAEEDGAIVTGIIRDKDTYGTGTEVNDLIIGGTGIDVLLGEGGDDVLVGGRGNDVLDGGASGHDYLKGGGGRDTYYAGAGDTVDDSDDDGIIIARLDDGTEYTLTGGRMQSGNYVSDDNKATYTLSGTTLSIQVQGASDAITVKNFNKGNLGITLADSTQNIGYSLTGDLKFLDTDPSKDGIQTVADENGNAITTTEVTPLANRLRGSGGDDFLDGVTEYILTGGVLNTGRGFVPPAGDMPGKINLSPLKIYRLHHSDLFAHYYAKRAA